MTGRTTTPRTEDDLRVGLAVQALRLRAKLRAQRNQSGWELSQQAGENVLADILDRHRRGDDGYLLSHGECGWCSEDCACGGMTVAWPCPEVRAVLDAVTPRSPDA